MYIQVLRYSIERAPFEEEVTYLASTSLIRENSEMILSSDSDYIARALSTNELLDKLTGGT